MAGFRLPLPGIGDVDPMRMLWLGGLAAMAAIEIIEWPVALAVGVGSYVAERMAREDMRQDMAVRA
jgi:urea transporter